MNKFAVFLTVFLLFTGAAWGQVEFSWSGSAPANNNWNESGNWTVVNANGVPAPNFPGDDGRTEDVVVIPGNVWSPGIIVNGNFTIKNMTTTGTSSPQVYISTGANVLTISDTLTLNTMFSTVNPSLVNITNFSVAAGTVAGLAINSNVRMNGALITMDAYDANAPIIIGPVTSTPIGNISAGLRPIIINIDNSATGNINIGNIESNGSITINTGTGNNNVIINDINSGNNNVTINVPNGTVTVPPGIPGIDYNNPNITVDTGDPSTGDPVVDYNGEHIVYGLHNPFAGDSAYFFINSDEYPQTVLPPNSSAPVANRNIYVVDVHDHADSLTVTTAGYIEFRGIYTSSQSLTLNPGTGGINLNNAHITLNGAGSVFNSGPVSALSFGQANLTSIVCSQTPVTLNGSSGYINRITAGVIRLGDITGNGNNLTLTATSTASEGYGAIIRAGTTPTTISGGFPTTPDISGNGTNIGALLVEGSAIFVNTGTYPSSTLTAASVTVTGAANIRNYIRTTGAQSYGSIVLDAAPPASGIRILMGTTVTMGAVDGGGCELRVVGNVVINGNIVNTRMLSVSGTSTINANVTTTNNATINGFDNTSQYYHGDATLNNNTVLTGPANAMVRFNGAVNGYNGNQSLQITTANAWFTQAVNNITVLTVTAGTTQINANVSTVNNQTYGGNVTLGGTAGTKTLTSSGGGIVTFGTATANTVTGGGNGLTITGNAVFNGPVSAVTTLNVTGTAAINTANITTTVNQIYGGNVTLGANITFAGSNPTNSTITFNGTVNSDGTARTLTVNTANVTFNGSVGADAVLASITVGPAYATAGRTIINTTEIRTNGTGTPLRFYGPVTLSQDLVITAGGTAAISAAVRFDNKVDSDAAATPRSLEISNAYVQFRDDTGVNNPLLSINVPYTGGGTAAAATNRICYEVRTTGNQTYSGPVRIDGQRDGAVNTHAIITATGVGSIVTLGANITNTASRQLTITAERIFFYGASAGAATSNATRLNDVTINGNVTLYNNLVTFNANATNTVRFNGTVNSDAATARSLTIATAGARFDDQVGGIFPLNQLNVAGASAVNGDITTTGNQTYAALTLGGTGTRTLTSSAGSVSANGVVSGTAGVTVNSSLNITMNNAANSINTAAAGSSVTLNIITGGTQRDISFRTTGNITLNAENNTANGIITIGQSGTLNIGSLKTTGNGSISLGTGAAPNRVGEITQTGTASTQNLLIWSSAGITLTDASNTVDAISVNSATGAVSLTNAGDLEIGIIDVTNITADAAVVTIESVSGNININGNISANRLILKADIDSGEITVSSTAAINVLSAGNHNTGAGSGTEAAIFVRAYSFTANAGAQEIRPGQFPGTGEMCVDTKLFTPNGRIHNNRFHFHGGVPSGMHLVYGFNINDDFRDNLLYYRVEPGAAPPSVPYKVTDNFNIYIIDANVDHSGLTFETGGTGYIEFRENNVFTGNSVNFNSNGTGGMRFYGGALTLSNNVFNDNIILVGGNPSSITAQSVTLGAITRGYTVDEDGVDVSVAAATGNLSLAAAAASGDVILNNITADIIHDLNVTVIASGSGSIEINQNVTTTGDQRYNGNIRINSARILKGSSVSLGTVSGAGFALTIDGLGTNNANAALSGGGNVSSLTVNGSTVLIDAVLITSGAGIAQNYNGDVEISGDVILSGLTGSTVRFNGTVDSVSDDLLDNLTIRNMIVNFNGVVGGKEPLTSITLGTNANETGLITFTNEIITEHLTINTTAAVTLDDNDNKISKITISGAGGNIKIVNNASLEITEINGTALNTNIVEINTAGDITQTGAITGNVELRLDSGGKIELNYNDPNTVSSNEISDLVINSAAGDVSFTNYGDIYLNHINIINAEDYVFTFESLTGDIFVSASIECLRLALIAKEGLVAINADITVHHDHHCYNEPAVGTPPTVYIYSESLSGAADIHLMDAQGNGGVCIFVEQPISYIGKVYDRNGNDTMSNRMHYHLTAIRNIIYRYGPYTDPLPSDVPGFISGQDIYIQAESFTGYIINARGQDVYIIDIYNNYNGSTIANTKAVNFESSPSGSIHIYGEYYSSRTLNLIPGTGGIHLWDTERVSDGSSVESKITLTETNSVFNSNRRPVTLNGSSAKTSTIEANTIHLGAISSYNNEDRSLTLTGNAVLEGSVSGVTDFTVSGTTVFTSVTPSSFTIEAENINFKNTLNAANVDITINNSGLYTQTGNVTLSGMFMQTGSGGVNLGGNVTTTNPARANAVISFGSHVALTGNSIFRVPATGGRIEVKSGLSGGMLSLAGGSLSTVPHGVLEFSMDSGSIGNIKIISGSNIVLAADKTVQQTNGSTLEIEGQSSPVNNTVLDISPGSWYIGTLSPPPSALYSFEGFNGGLILGTGSRLITVSFNLTGNFSLMNAGSAEIIIRGDTAIGSGVNITQTNLPYLLFDMTGNGTQNLNAAQRIGSLYVRSTSVTTLLNDLGVSGEVYIDHFSSQGGVLNAQSNDIVLFAGLNESKDGVPALIGRWRIDNGTLGTGGHPVQLMNAFVQAQDHSVTFKRYNPSDANVFFEIIGNTMWRKFLCDEQNGAVIQFSTHPNQHVFLESFEVKGSAANRVRLTRLPFVEKNGVVEIGNENWVTYYNYAQHGAPAQVPLGSGQSHPLGIPSIPEDPNLKNNLTEREKFWNFNLYQLAGLQIDYVEIYFSHAWNEPMIVESDAAFIPYYENTLGYFNHNWREEKVFKIIYSFIEDSNGNGRADRIRVQTSVTVNVNTSAPFAGFEVNVEGYTVEKFELTQSKTGSISDNDSFYIILKEKPYLYDGMPISWRITNNTQTNGSPALYDGRGRSVGKNDGTIFTTFNTIPPRISYTLTLPNHTETYIQMSQPSAPWSSSLFTGTINGNPAMTYALDEAQRPRGSLVHYIDPDNPVTLNLKSDQPAVSGASSFLIESSGASNTITSLSSGSVTFDMQGLWNLAERAIDWNLFDENFPPPKYPVDWNYSGYLAYPGNDHIEGSLNNPVPVTNMFVPPFQVLTQQMMIDLEAGNSVTPSSFQSGGDLITRRNTDVLVSLPPAASDSVNYFAWPVWARFVNPLNPDPDAYIDTQGEFWGEANTDTGIIWEFDGTKYLEARGNVEIQVHLNPSLQGALEIFWSSNVAANNRNPAQGAVRGRSLGGLWIPNIISPLYYYYAPPSDLNPLGSVYQQTPGSGSTPALFNYLLNGRSSGEKIEFIFRLDNTADMFMARLDIPRGAAIPFNWYRLVRPFSFDIQDITSQRGGVTIMNNVINSDKREPVYIRYKLVRPGRVTIQVYTLEGTLVRSIRRNEYREAGEYTDFWNGTNNGDRPIARGMYFIRVVGPDIDEVRKVMVVR